MERAIYRPGMKLGPRDLYVGRGLGRTDIHSGLPPNRFGWLGNPYDSKIFGLDECIEMYAKAFISKIQIDPEFRDAVHSLDIDRVLCWCRLNKNCHGDFIMAYLQEYAGPFRELKALQRRFSIGAVLRDRDPLPPD